MGAAVALAVLAFAAGSVAQPHVPLWWDRDPPAMADGATAHRLVRAQQAEDELRVTRETVLDRLAAERLTQTSEVVEASGADPARRAALSHRIQDRDVLMATLRTRLDQAVAAQVPADRELRIATEKSAESRDDAATRIARSAELSRTVLTVLAWGLFALVIGLWRGIRRLIHTRTVLVGGLAGALVLRLAVEAGWLPAAIVVVALLGFMILRTGRSDAGQS